MKKIKDKRYRLLSFFIPLLILIVIFIFLQVLTGKYTVLLSDLKEQYYNFLCWFQNAIKTGDLAYSFSAGFGGGMIGTISYYLSSPINLILGLFNHNSVLPFITVMILLKIPFCGFTMFTFLKYHFKDAKAWQLLVFSTAYSLSTYIIANSFQIIWLDAYLLLPLILLGLDKLIKEDKLLLYGICLFIAILSNYYMGFLICIFSVIYFIYRYCLVDKQFRNKKVISKFLIVSILAGLMTMFLSLPTLLQLMETGRNDSSLFALSNFKLNTHVIDYINMVFIGSFDSGKLVINNPYIYCGMFVIPLLYFYFANKNIPKKEKMLSFSIFILLLLAMNINFVNYIFHAFTEPHGFNHRYMFGFIIFILYFSCRSFLSIKDIKKYHFLIIGIIITVIGLVCCIFDFKRMIYIDISVLLSLIYIFILYLINQGHKSSNELKGIFIFLGIAELFFNVNTTLKQMIYVDSVDYYGYEEDMRDFLDITKKDASDDLFYRVESYNSELNDWIIYNARGASYWSSSSNKNLIDFNEKMGYLPSKVAYQYASYLIYDSLIGIQYYQSENNIDYYEEIGKNTISHLRGFMYNAITKDVIVYKNPYALDLGYMIHYEDLNCKNLYECQVMLLSSMSGIDNQTYVRAETKKDNLVFYVQMDHSKTLKAIINGHLIDGVLKYDLYIDDHLVDTKEDSIISINFDQEINKEIKIEIVPIVGTIDSIEFYNFYPEKAISSFQELSKNQLQLTEFKDGYVKGNIEIKERNTLFLSIPYEKGWTAYVDGEEQDIKVLYDTFIGLDLESGTHEIELVYHIPYFKEGIIISSVSLIGFSTFIFINYIKRKKVNNYGKLTSE